MLLPKNDICVGSVLGDIILQTLTFLLLPAEKRDPEFSTLPQGSVFLLFRPIRRIYDINLQTGHWISLFQARFGQK